MGQNENTQNEKSLEQNQSQAGPGHDSPGPMQQESPRVCKVCGGPNHYGCGCEAKRQAKAMVDIENIHKVEQPESEAPAAEKQAEKEAAFHSVIEDILSRLSTEDVKKILEGEFDFAKDIKTMADGFGGLCACMYDTNSYLKIIAGDLITIRKFLTKEDEVKNAAENQN